jgi:hypothetical protein
VGVSPPGAFSEDSARRRRHLYYIRCREVKRSVGHPQRRSRSRRRAAEITIRFSATNHHDPPPSRTAKSNNHALLISWFFYLIQRASRESGDRDLRVGSVGNSSWPNWGTFLLLRLFVASVKARSRLVTYECSLLLLTLAHGCMCQASAGVGCARLLATQQRGSERHPTQRQLFQAVQGENDCI